MNYDKIQIGAIKNKPLIATIEEHTDFTWRGTVAAIALVIFQFIVVAGFGAAKSAVQEASIGTVWIAVNVLLVGCAIMGRKRTLKVYREPID